MCERAPVLCHGALNCRSDMNVLNIMADRRAGVLPHHPYLFSALLIIETCLTAQSPDRCAGRARRSLRHSFLSTSPTSIPPRSPSGTSPTTRSPSPGSTIRPARARRSCRTAGSAPTASSTARDAISGSASIATSAPTSMRRAGRCESRRRRSSMRATRSSSRGADGGATFGPRPSAQSSAAPSFSSAVHGEASVEAAAIARTALITLNRLVLDVCDLQAIPGASLRCTTRPQ